MHPFAARMAAAKMAKYAKHGKTKRQVGKKRAAKVVRAVARETAKDAKQIKKVARKVAKKVGKRTSRSAVAASQAAHQVAQQCAKELKSVRAKAEMALALGNIGHGLNLGGGHHGRPKRRTKVRRKKPHHAASHAPRHAREEVTARSIMAGAVKKKPAKKFWVCAGEVRTGCGHGGATVVGSGSMHRATRVR